MLSTVHSGALMRIEAWPVTVEEATGERGEPAPVVVYEDYPLSRVWDDLNSASLPGINLAHTPNRRFQL